MYKDYNGYHGSGGGGVIGQGASSCDQSRGGSPYLGYDTNYRETGQFSVNDLALDDDVNAWSDATKIDTVGGEDWFSGAPGGHHRWGDLKSDYIFFFPSKRTIF